MEILNAGHEIRKFGQLMVMRRKYRLCMKMQLNVLNHRPCQRQPVKGGCSTANFIENDEAFGGSRIQDDCCLRHLNHEGRPAPSQIVRSANPGENSVEDGKTH